MRKRVARSKPSGKRAIGKRAPGSKPARKGSPRKREPLAQLASFEVQEIESLRDELGKLADRSRAPRWNADPDDVRRSVAKLVLTLVEFIRQVLERQAIRRMGAGTLTAEETESVGLALMRLEETINELGGQFGLAPEDLNLDLGPIGKLV